MRCSPRALVVPLLVAVFALTGCGPSEESNGEEAPKPTVSVLEVRSGLRREFTVTGNIVAEQYASITSEFRADVAEVKVRPGDAVRAGSELVVLQSATIRAQYDSARASYTRAAQSVEQARITGNTTAESARIGLESARSNLDTTIRKNQARRTQAEETLNGAKINLNLSISTAQTSLENAIRSSRNTANDALQFAEQLLEIRSDNDDITYVQETHIGVRDPAFHLKVRQAVLDARKQLDLFQPDGEAALLVLQQVEVVMEMVQRTLENSITSADRYTEVQHSANITTVTRHIGSVRSAVSSLSSAQRALETARQESQRSKSQVLIDAQAAYETTIADIEASELTAQRAVEEAEIAYQAARASASVSEISALSSLTSVGGQLTQARISNDKLTIVAPFDGVTADVSVLKGDEVNVGDHLVTVQNDSTIKIVTYLSPLEVRGVRVGDIVTLENGGLAHITSVAPSADPVSKKYKVEVLDGQSNLQPGEFIRLTFSATTDEEDARIFLPVTAVQVKASETFVWTLSQSGSLSVTRKRPISIGTIEGKFIEIKKGLQEGDTVIIEGARNLTTEGTAILRSTE